jgi:uncharacterized protein YyaL (SSP411 family)
MPNALVHERSPYLRAHAQNPVDWLPFGEVAFARARKADLPLLISIGYASCHWCHVMERESFSDPKIAEQMNAGFVCVKVDREERPDLDAIYMDAIHSLQGRGGWPLNVFCTPAGIPFFAGTYYPPQRRGAMPSWAELLGAIAEAWRNERDQIDSLASRLAEALSASAKLRSSGQAPQAELLEHAERALAESFDEQHGGFGTGTKFPQPCVLELLLARARRAGLQSPSARMVRKTLDAIATGGMRDHLDGGFHRYSTDRAWRIPHFEKMLYDNALLARLFARAAVQFGDAHYSQVAHAALRWALEQMRGAEGCFYSSIDADSEGREGALYLWRASEIEALLGELAPAALAWLCATSEGNFIDPYSQERGWNVLIARGPAPAVEVQEQIRARLLDARRRRPQAAVDEKRIVSWNGLMICALAECSQLLREPLYLEAAERCAEHILTTMRRPDGTLSRILIAGETHGSGFLEDHAQLLEGLIALFEASCRERWLVAAQELAEVLISHFYDPVRGGFFTARAHERQIAARKDIEDNPTPSGNSSAALALLRLSQLQEHEQAARAARRTLALLRDPAERFPLAFGYALLAIERSLAAPAPLACPLGPDRSPPAPRAGGEDRARS